MIIFSAVTKPQYRFSPHAKKGPARGKNVNAVSRRACGEMSNHWGRKTKRPDRRVESVYESRALDLDKKISVRLVHRTLIFVNPDADIDQIKRVYLKHMQDKLKN